ncbi:MAG: TIGR01777 family oxidoreductase [Rikenellaceae bacterium]
MKIAVSGATGFIGNRLVGHLSNYGHNVIPLGREFFAYDSTKSLQEVIDDVDAVINLAGAPIDKRWSRKYKESILESRIITTRKIVHAINHASQPKTLISASAVGYYPSVGCYDEYSRVENYTFLSYVCRLWEAEARKLNVKSRLVITRFGVVFSPMAGALPRMIATKDFGFLTRIGAPERPMTWVDREDLVRALRFIAENDDMEGVINIVAPRFTLQHDFLAAASQKHNTRFIIPIHSLLLRIIMGGASEVLLHGACVSSSKLHDAGFKFYTESIHDFFANNTITDKK